MVLAAIPGISVVLTVIGLIVLCGWVADQVLGDVLEMRRNRRLRQ
jgi:hypothetical protein